MQKVSNISLLWLHAANLNVIGCKWMIYSFKIVLISLWLNWMCSLSSVIRQLSYGQVIPLCLFDLTSSGTNGSIRWREALGGRSSMNLSCFWGTELSRIPDDKLENTDQSGLFDLLRRLTLSSLWKWPKIFSRNVKTKTWYICHQTSWSKVSFKNSLFI